MANITMAYDAKFDGWLTRLMSPLVTSNLTLVMSIFVIVTSSWSLIKLIKERFFLKAPSPPEIARSSSKFKVPDRKPGKWKPVAFKRPAAKPYPDWNIETTKPLPYRPFKYGPYHITMGLRRMNWDEWIELDNQWPKYHKRKLERIAERGPMLTRTAPEAYDAACELLEELCDYLPQRYPSLFEKTTNGMKNLYNGDDFNVVRQSLNEDPMQIAARMLQDDLGIMIERADGQYYFLAGAVILPGAWRLKDKFGMPLSEIHTSGNVPGYKTKLEKGMMNFFRRIQPDEPVLRNNYFFQLDDDIAWNRSLGPENFDEVDGADAPVTQTIKHHWESVEASKSIEHHWFRTERQSVRRLPRSGGVAFIFRTYFHRVTEIAEEPGVPGRLASAVRSWGADVAKYKGREKYQDVLLDYLDMKHREQVEKGIVDEAAELDKESYPF